MDVALFRPYNVDGLGWVCGVSGSYLLQHRRVDVGRTYTVVD